MKNLSLKKFIPLIFCLALFTCCNKASAKTETSSPDNSNDNSSDTFTILSFSPSEELPALVKYPSIQIQFSEPVVALSALGKTAAKSEFVKIEPEIQGKFRWLGTSLLSFDAKDKIILQKEYKVTVSNNLTSVNGKKISGQLQYSFHSEELKLVSIVPAFGEVSTGNYIDNEEVPVDKAKDIAVYFNAPVNPEILQQELKIETDKEKYEFTAEKLTDSTLRITVKNNIAENETIFVTLPKDSMADKDCYKTSEDQILSFHTIKPFALTSFDYKDVYTDSSFKNPVRFSFNHLLVPDSAEEISHHLTTLPSMKITKDNIHVDGKTFILHSLPVDFNSIYTVLLDNQLKDVYGKTLSDQLTFDVQVPEAASYVHFKNWGFNILEAQFAPKIAFSYQNVVKENSWYSVNSILDAAGKQSSQAPEKIYFEDKEIPENTTIIEGVDLQPFLTETDKGYRGTVEFNASVNYKEKHTDWRTKEVTVETETAENNQIIQVTDLAVTCRYGYNKLIALVTSLSTGKPVPQVQVTAYGIPYMYNNKQVLTNSKYFIATGTTDEKGFVKIDLPKNSFQTLSNNHSNIYLEAKTDKDYLLFNPNITNMYRSSTYGTSYPQSAEQTNMVTFIYTDRGLYKPGETVSFSGIDKNLTKGNYEPYTGTYRISLQDSTWRPKVYDTINSTTSQNGTFSGSFVLPEDLKPATYYLAYTRNINGKEQTKYESFTIQFFERLRFEAKATVAPLTYYSGDKINAQISAQYLGGGSLGGCAYQTYWTCSPYGFSPDGKKYEDYRFGPLQGYDGTTTLNTAEGTLSGDGKATETQQTGAEKIKGTAYLYRMEANITDSGNQVISTVANTVVHPAKFYIGLSKAKNLKGFPKKGDTLTFNYLCVTPEGTIPEKRDLPSDTSNKLKVELLREEWKQVQQISWNGQLNTRYVREMICENEFQTNLKAKENVEEIKVTVPKGGAYILRLSTQDSKGSEVISETRFYATSSDWFWFNRDNSEEITMITDKDSYSVGETASILVQSPLPKGTYILTVEREGLISEELLQINEPTSTLEIPIKEEYVPVMYVTLSTYSTRTSEPKNSFNTADLDKPKGYFGLAALCVDTATRQFNIDISTDKNSYLPGEEATITLHASKNDQPLQNAEITLMAVDRGVIDLINYHVPDPISYFYNKYLFPNCVKGGDSRSLLMDPVTYEVKNLLGGDSMAKEASKMEERKNFDPTAIFLPSLITDENGDVTCTFILPDTLTAYRITAVGVSNDSFALQEDEMSVANPISVREVLPKKLRVDDLSEAGVTISNISSDDYDVTVKLEITEGLEKSIESIYQKKGQIQKMPGKTSVKNDSVKTIHVKANSTETLMFDIFAEKEGWATLIFTVESDILNERILKPLENEKPIVYETVTTVGQVTGEGKTEAITEEKIAIPASSGNMGNLFIQLDSSQLGSLHDAVDYVFRYPYGCLEQRSAFVFPLVAFGKYMKILGLDKEVKEPQTVAANEIKSWANYQLPDGGFPYWPNGLYSNKFVSFRIAEILSIANQKNIITYSESGIDIQKLSEYIQKTVTQLEGNEQNSSSLYLRAYGYYLLSLLGHNVSENDIISLADNQLADIDSMSFCALALIQKDCMDQAQTIADKLTRYIKQTARGVSLTPIQKSYSWSFYNDKSENLALLLSLYTKLNPDNILNSHLVYELLDIAKNNYGYWRSTVITARVLTAFDTYIQANNLENTDFSAEALIDGKKFIEGKFRSLNANVVSKTVEFSEEPLASIKRDEELPLVFKKSGNGKLYYTASMKYRVPAENQYAREEGISIFSEIIDVKTGEPVEENNLIVGNVYRKVIYITSNAERNYLAVRAPIPSGAEVINAAFVTTGSLNKYENPVTEEDSTADDYEKFFYLGNLSQQYIYDNEVQYFWDYFPTGYQKVDFLFRAARKGVYQTPGDIAECMYEPEVFGRSTGSVWNIK